MNFITRLSCIVKGDFWLNLTCCYSGSVLSGGGSVPSPRASVETWVKMVNEMQRGAMSTRLGIPIIYGIDAVHGHNNVYKATIFPRNVGFGATGQVHLMVSCQLH